jgi:hypothetical protein
LLWETQVCYSLQTLLLSDRLTNKTFMLFNSRHVGHID